MAFDKSKLGKLAGSDGFTLWHYKTGDDAKATIDTAGYFNDAADYVRVSDLIIVEDSTPEVGLMVVSSNSSGTVDVNDMVTAGTSDTD